MKESLVGVFQTNNKCSTNLTLYWYDIHFSLWYKHKVKCCPCVGNVLYGDIHSIPSTYSTVRIIGVDKLYGRCYVEMHIV